MSSCLLTNPRINWPKRANSRDLPEKRSNTFHRPGGLYLFLVATGILGGGPGLHHITSSLVLVGHHSLCAKKRHENKRCFRISVMRKSHTSSQSPQEGEPLQGPGTPKRSAAAARLPVPPSRRVTSRRQERTVPSWRGAARPPRTSFLAGCCRRTASGLGRLRGQRRVGDGQIVDQWRRKSSLWMDSSPTRSLSAGSSGCRPASRRSMAAVSAATVVQSR